MRTIIILQARMSSSRRPGKVLEVIQGKPMLQYLCESLDRCRRSHGFVVATSDDQSDDVIDQFCSDRGIRCIRGPLEDVTQRFAEAVRQTRADAFVRICGDSPLLDYRLVDHAIDQFAGSGCHLVSNTLKRTYPKGQSVEVVDASVFLSAMDRMTTHDEREHVTAHFYLNPGDYVLGGFEYDRDCSHMQLSVDTAEDMAAIREFIARLNRPHWAYSVDELIDLYEELRS